MSNGINIQKDKLSQFTCNTTKPSKIYGTWYQQKQIKLWERLAIGINLNSITIICKNEHTSDALNLCVIVQVLVKENN